MSTIVTSGHTLALGPGAKWCDGSVQTSESRENSAPVAHSTLSVLFKNNDYASANATISHPM